MIKGAERIVKVEDEIYQRYTVYCSNRQQVNEFAPRGREHILLYLCQPGLPADLALLKAFDARR